MLVCSELDSALQLLKSAGFRLDAIFPADAPHTAMLSLGESVVRLTTLPDAPSVPDELPAFEPAFVLSSTDDPGGEGRAGMRYRDLIPGRLGGRYVASHIRITEGGPVADWVHYHRVAFQMIFVRSGWVRVVYEDQGEPFVMAAGDLVLQPPGIRHRVLESSPGLEVIEIGCPAIHETLTDHDLELPNASVAPDRLFGGQRFIRHVADDAGWSEFHGAEIQATAMLDATGGLADVRVLRPGRSPSIDFPPHDGELVFGFVLEGSATLDFEGEHPLMAGSAFVIPPERDWTLDGPSADFRFLHVTTAKLGQNVLATNIR
ncbi:MAG: cupin domain-containing protein [Sphingomonas sp.]|nr:cupin domain-containing protein [Sphingomonas sp.]